MTYRLFRETSMAAPYTQIHTHASDLETGILQVDLRNMPAAWWDSAKTINGNAIGATTCCGVKLECRAVDFDFRNRTGAVRVRFEREHVHNVLLSIRLFPPTMVSL